MSESKNVSMLTKISFSVFLITTFLLPIFFIPSIQVPLDVSKGLLFSIGITLSFIFWLVSRLVEGKFLIPKDPLMLSVIILPLVFFISALLAPKAGISIFGYGFEIGTAMSILMFSVAMFLASTFFQDKTRISYFFMSLFASFGIIVLFELIQLFFGIIGNAPGFFAQLSSSNLVGSWNDLGAFSGLIAILSLLALELLPLKRMMKGLLWTAVVLSLVLLAIVNFFSLWMIVGILSLIVFVYTFSVSVSQKKEKDEEQRTFPAASFAVVLISLMFIISNNFFGGFLPSFFGVSNVEIRPSVSGTFQVMENTLARDPILGSGPNRFSHEWFLGRPEAVNTTNFWNSNFNAGFNVLLTFIVTTGILGGLVWLAFILYFFYKGVVSSAFSSQDKISTFFSFSSFATALYLWILALAYVPNIVLFGLAFIATGVFVGILVNRKDIGQYTISFLKDPRTSFFSILLIVALVVGTVSVGYGFVKKFSSIVSFERGIRALNQNPADLGLAEQKLLRALSFSPNDFYYRSLSEIYIARLGTLLNDETLSEETIKTELQSVLSLAEQAARGAVTYDDENYLNWISLGLVYESIVPLGVEGSYQSSKAAYEEALTRNPKNPGIHLNLARLEIANKDIEAAKAYIATALQGKQNYLDAYYLLSSIALSAGDTKAAIAELEKATAAVPSSPDAFFQLGVLRFNNKDYTGATGAFERAVILSPRHLDARYLLALSYERTGKKDLALGQLNILKEVLPENETVLEALSKLEKGQPLVSASTTVPATGTGEFPDEEAE